MASVSNSNLPDSGRQAPSEKHLEDYLWNHPEALGMVGIPPQYGEDIPMYKFALRQFRLSSGIVDLVGFDWRLCAFELKKGTLKAQALTQVMRYIRDLRWITNCILHDCLGDDFCRPWAAQYDHPTWVLSEQLVRGVLIGHDVEDDNLLIACAACGVDVFLYDYVDGEYEFTGILVPEGCHGDDYENAQRLARGSLGNAFIAHFEEDIVNAYAEAIRQHNTQFDAANAANEYVNKVDDLDGAV